MFLEIVYYCGVFVFAVSGSLAAVRKQLDYVGTLALASATSLGGGTIRDLILDREVFWMLQPEYIWVSIAGAVSTVLYIKFAPPPKNSLLIFDAIGLGFFSILGVKIVSEYSDSFIIITVLAIFTGVLGGVIRDVLSNEVPLLFKSSEPLYSVSALSGIIVYQVLIWLSIAEIIASTISIGLIILVRLLSIKFKISLPEINFHHKT